MIKRVLRYSVISLFTLLITRQILGTPQFDLTFTTLIKLGLIFSIFEIFLKPIIKILFLPLNLITLGLFRFIISIPAFLFAGKFLSSFAIRDVQLKASNWQGFVIPAFDFNGFWALVVTSLIYSFFFYLLKSILLKK